MNTDMYSHYIDFYNPGTYKYYNVYFTTLHQMLRKKHRMNNTVPIHAFLISNGNSESRLAGVRILKISGSKMVLNWCFPYGPVNSLHTEF